MREKVYNTDTGAQKMVWIPKCKVRYINQKKISIGIALKKKKMKDMEKLMEEHFGKKKTHFKVI